MGMAMIRDHSIVFCIESPTPYSRAEILAAYRRIMMDEQRDTPHSSEKNLKAVKNDKLKGAHCKPFYQKERW